AIAQGLAAASRDSPQPADRVPGPAQDGIALGQGVVGPEPAPVEGPVEMIDRRRPAYGQAGHRERVVAARRDRVRHRAGGVVPGGPHLAADPRAGVPVRVGHGAYGTAEAVLEQLTAAVQFLAQRGAAELVELRVAVAVRADLDP